MSNYKLKNVFVLLSILEGLNYLLMGPYLSDPNIFEEFVANILIILGIGVAFIVSILMPKYLNTWIILSLIISWIGIIRFFIQSDLDLIEEGWIKIILRYKIFLANIFWFWISLFSFAIIVKSVYYDGILVILNIASKPNPELIDINIQTINV